MVSVKATVETPVEASIAYKYLCDRYEGPAYRSACGQAKGYIPPVARLEAVDNAKSKTIRFHVPGRDPVLRMGIGGWTWTYELEDLGNSATRVTIEYRWPWLFSLLGLGTIKHQAANALTQDVLALEALAFTSPSTSAAV